MTPVTLNDDVFAEILLRLPPKSVLRFRAVCKLWRSITTSAPFIAAYNRRQSLELLLICPDNSYILGTGGENAVAAVVPLDGTGTGCRRLLRHSATLKLFGSCDGLLLFSQHYESFLVCNPATRQWASLPAPTPRPCFWAVPSGFYHHRPSGEYRVLCFGQEVLYVRDPLTGVYGPPADSQRPLDQCYRVHYVLSTGGNTEPRRLGPMERRPGPAYNSIPAFGVAVGGILYWNKHPQIGKTSKMLAFDTVTEAFRRMPLPSVTGREYKDLSLFDMHGTLAASVVAEWPYLQVWALDGVGESTWSRRLCVELPAMQGQRRSWLFGTEDTELSRLFVDMEPFAPPDRGPSRLLNEAVAGLDGDMLVVFASGWVVLYDMKEKKMVSKVDHNHNCSRMWWCVHRESLVPVLKSQPSPDGKPILHFPDNLLEGQPAPDGEPAILAFPSQIQDATSSLVPDLL